MSDGVGDLLRCALLDGLGDEEGGDANELLITVNSFFLVIFQLKLYCIFFVKTTF
jgi:hypothetical protein